MIDYAKEVKTLDSFVPGNASKFWKAKPGQFKVKALTELEEAEPFVEEGKEPKPQMKITMLVEDAPEKVTWTFSKGVSPASTYGQLCKLALQLGGLKDKEFLVVVTSDNKKNTYTIVKL